jgi:predicted nucleic acid-binding protein
MVILIDTNVLLDVLLTREPFYQDSLAVLRIVEEKKVQGWIAANSVDNIYYIACRHLAPEKSRALLSTLLQVVDVVAPGKKEILAAIACKMNDLEDAIQAMCASKVKAKAIITRNVRDYQKSPVPPMTPAEFLQLMAVE